MKAKTISLFLVGTFGQATLGCQELIEVSQDTLQSLLPASIAWNSTRSVEEFVLTSNLVATGRQTNSEVLLDLITPAEASNFSETATYAQVTDFFTRLAEESEYVQVKSLVTLANGEDLWLVTVSGEGKFTAQDMTKPTVFVTAGIHPGESSGVNAGMMFVRNLVLMEENEELLMALNFLFIPILNVDGYLRQSAEGRVNQFGPNTSGRRANSKWMNLNRDFSKLDTPEIQAAVGIMRDYDLTFYIDMHSTDGINYQDDVTWCDNGDAGLSNEIYAWLRTELQTDLEMFLEGYNHIPGPCYFANDPFDPTAGFYPYFSDGPTFSANYADHVQIPAYLLEIHSLKPNKQRVLGAYAFLLGVMTTIAAKTDSLQTAIAADRAARVDPVPITWDFDDPAPMFDWKIFEYEVVQNPVLGIEQMVWSDVPMTITVENQVRSVPLDPPKRPYAYILPAVWTEAINVLKMHGIVMEYFTEAASVSNVTVYRIDDFSIAASQREGRATGSGTPVTEMCASRAYGINDILIKTDQPLGTLAVALLEPVGEGSLFYWGFFNSKFTSHEYTENYIMVPLAVQMLQDSPELAAEWETYKTENPSVANNTDTVVEWFFRRSAYYDSEAFVLPVEILYEAPSEELPTEVVTAMATVATEADNTIECPEVSSGVSEKLVMTSLLGVAAASMALQSI